MDMLVFHYVQLQLQDNSSQFEFIILEVQCTHGSQLYIAQNSQINYKDAVIYFITAKGLKFNNCSENIFYLNLYNHFES